MGSFLLSVILLLSSIMIFAEPKKSGDRIESPVKITFKNKVSDPQKELKFFTSDGREVPFITNRIDDKNYVVAPLEYTGGLTLQKNSSVSSVVAYNGEIFVQSKANWDKIQKFNESSLSKSSFFLRDGVKEDRAVNEAAPSAQADGKGSAGGSQKSSETNVQVKGIDEADIVKVLGDRIYYLIQEKLYVAKVDNGKIVQEYKMNIEKNFYARDLYVDNNRLILIGEKNANNKIYTTATVYDMTDAKKPKIYRSFSQEGHYASSRKADKRIYLISEAYVYPKNGVLPTYLDSAAGNKEVELDLSMLRIYPPYITDSITSIASFAIDNKNAAQHTNFVGSSENVYMNAKSLYISYMDYFGGGGFIPRPIPFDPETPFTTKSADGALNEQIDITDPDAMLPKTIIKKFSIDQGKATYVGETKFVGYLINQFAMDENNGYLRIAYTRDLTKGSEVAVFDSKMKPVGKLSGIAPSEQIYSARFMGDRLYLVTFKQVDPFFVIDLKNPKAPKILGYLKIPGYSEYLHPYDDNHIIGFGRDTVESEGGVRNGGMKLAMFDVTDVKNPKQISGDKIGAEGTYSELLYNHKALMYNAEKKYFGFPVSVTKKVSQDPKAWWRTETQFQGGYIYEVGKDFSLKLKGKTTHHKTNVEDRYNYDIERLVYVGDYIYSVSPKMISSNRASDLKEIQAIQWK